MNEIEKWTKYPFASYDLIVYFGGGVFFVAAFGAIIQLDGFWEPSTLLLFSSSTAIVLAFQIIATAYTIYLIGHLCSFGGSQFVEKTLIRVMDYPDRAGKVAIRVGHKKRNSHFRGIIWHRLKSIIADAAILSSVVRIGFHLPLISHYVFFNIGMGIFGFYESRVTEEANKILEAKFRKIFPHGPLLNGPGESFRLVEQYTINTYHASNGRIYNYMLIYGLLRSLVFTLLLVSWLLILSIVFSGRIFPFDLDIIDNIVFTHLSERRLVFIYLSVTTLAWFSMMSFGKFFRRYSEEVVYSFIMGKDDLFHIINDR